MLRRKGLAVPRWQVGSLPVFRGRLVVDEIRMPDMGRSSRQALLTEGDDLDGHAPALYDTQLLRLTSEVMVLTGFEIDGSEVNEVHYLQTWWITLPSSSGRDLGLQLPPAPPPGTA